MEERKKLKEMSENEINVSFTGDELELITYGVLKLDEKYVKRVKDDGLFENSFMTLERCEKLVALKNKLCTILFTRP